MDALKEALFAIDAMIFVVLILGGFIVYELRSGEVPLRWFGSIRRERNPIIYWIAVFFHVGILMIVVYAWMLGGKLPLGDFFNRQ